jgi:hypothetical protein
MAKLCLNDPVWLPRLIVFGASAIHLGAASCVRPRRFRFRAGQRSADATALFAQANALKREFARLAALGPLGFFFGRPTTEWVQGRAIAMWNVR